MKPFVEVNSFVSGRGMIRMGLGSNIVCSVGNVDIIQDAAFITRIRIVTGNQKREGMPILQK
jgi:hypothetical protein